MRDAKKLRLLADMLEKAGMPRGFEDLPPDPATEVLRRVADQLDAGRKRSKK